MLKFWKFWVIGFFLFTLEFFGYIWRRYVYVGLLKFEFIKSFAVIKMYQQRGKYAQMVIHSSVMVIMLLGITLGPSLVVNNGQVEVKLNQEGKMNVVLASASDGNVLGESESQVLATAGTSMTLTQVSDKPRSEVISYTVENGDTLGVIAEKFGVSIDTLLWANETIKKTTNIRPGDTLNIPPVTGLIHTVKSGETIYSVAKKYGIEAQAIVDFPFNNFVNDETFALAIGQTLVIPDGMMPQQDLWSTRTPTLARVLTPDAGAVSATGSWTWPASGHISQPFRAWHKGLDVANKSGGPILAADAGVVTVAGWPDNSGYGNRVVVDHGNGYQTLYAHLSRISVTAGQRVNQGDKLGDMGSTGRSTGTHLHFEVRSPNGNLDPQSVLR
jgi:murein DD-endopeptidase MepM/ murein hydrolase activator NlpD